jgi:phosphatidylinositol glycan class Z
MQALALTLIQKRASFFAHIVLAFIAVVGVFNRITFPAFLVVPGLQLLPHFKRKYVLQILS